MREHIDAALEETADAVRLFVKGCKKSLKAHVSLVEGSVSQSGSGQLRIEFLEQVNLKTKAALLKVLAQGLAKVAGDCEADQVFVAYSGQSERCEIALIFQSEQAGKVPKKEEVRKEVLFTTDQL